MPTIHPGVWPVMLTPFTDDGSIDWDGVDRLVDYYVAAGAAGLFAVALSSEMYELTPEERPALAARVVKRVDGRVPVVASGTFGGPALEQAAYVRRMADAGVDAVVVLSCQLAAAEESDAVWQANAERLLALTGDVPLGLYECPVPYKRVLTAAAMGWAARTGRFLFHKDTCCRMDLIRAKIEAVQGTSFRFFNANAATLLSSLHAGGDGFSGIGANYFTDLYAWMCRHHRAQPELAQRLQRFLSIAEMTICHRYPASAKRFRALDGLAIGDYCRASRPQFDEEDMLRLQHLLEYAAEWRQQLAIATPPR
ncbi:MAG: dihydrodipicolinate synthase family protein [Anaerolineae bacterium]